MFDSMMLSNFISRLFTSAGDDLANADAKVQLLRALLSFQIMNELNNFLMSQSKVVSDNINKSTSINKTSNQLPLVTFISDLFSSDVIFNLLMVNEYDGIRYFNKEKFDLLVDWLSILTGITFIKLSKVKPPVTTAVKKKFKAANADLKKSTLPDFNEFKQISEQAGYDIDKFLELVKENKKLETKKHKQKLTRGKIEKAKK